MQKTFSTNIPAFLSSLVSPNRAIVAVAPICQVEAQCKAKVTLQCGDGNMAGLVQYWHTPFGDLHPGLHSELGPVYVQHEGNLVLPNISRVHSGLYYCLLQHKDGITLWPHELHVSQESGRCNQPSGYVATRSRKDVGSLTERQGGVSDGHFTGAVVGSVLLTFVVGFSAGALCRNQVLRCLGALIARLRSPENDVPDHASEVSMTTLSPVINNHAVDIEQAETMTSSTASLPPAKPQRSFREKRQDEREITNDLKGCEGPTKEGEGEEEEEKRRSSVKTSVQEFNGETKVKDKEEDGEGRTHLAEDKGRKLWFEEEREEEEEGGALEGLSKGCDKETEFDSVDGYDETTTNEERQEPVKKEGKEKKKEENGDQEDRSKEGEAVRSKWEEDKGTDGTRDEEDRRREYDGKKDSEEEESPAPEQPPRPAAPRPARPSRVIRLYQYDDEGQRYSHVPQPPAEEPGPAPRLQQRSISLTRLSAIMAAASAGPLDTRDTEREESSHFQMEI
ncbi:uncharacterized protein LOC130535414 isoform X2 [Takifugu flavidus]|uniref:uncharacterized protein LOC130535414 isoform X2 n=1 Tax=Takifugu flavidus TaxID=433684 RepID=UPI002544BC1E|nr:uncharacterized protein LOC130535414 isoform X2 [Takifugu flavidus]